MAPKPSLQAKLLHHVYHERLPTLPGHNSQDKHHVHLIRSSECGPPVQCWVWALKSRLTQVRVQLPGKKRRALATGRLSPTKPNMILMPQKEAEELNRRGWT